LAALLSIPGSHTDNRPPIASSATLQPSAILKARE
jgi:hypothetical protein